MPALFAVCQHSALATVRTRLQPNEHLMAFHDDLYVLCRPERVVQVFSILRAELWQHDKIQIHLGKTQVWNRGSTAPENIDVLQQEARMVDPDAVVWRADENIPTEDEGVVILGTPLGARRLCAVAFAIEVGFPPHSAGANPLYPDLQSAWLILLFCASRRAIFLLRALPPSATREFAIQ